MDTNESCVPPGFRFHQQMKSSLVTILEKIASQKIDLDVIRDIDLYRIEPWDLQDKCRIGYEEQNRVKSDWIMHEYRLESEENGPPQEEGWVVCRAFKKKITGQTKSNMVEGWESNYFYDEATTAVSSVVDPLEYIHQGSMLLLPSNFNMVQNNLLCKQEMEAAAENNLNFAYTSVIHNSYSFHS
ncbi:hypothetical protein HAX54_001314 [Datura stramonium]|uniref:NAC domain-containing protein n=1 Tax=Datura stramonium TaxID=4076 RepID=A0ABS8RSI0_DATST|nr:hypothetical protein [Datura stramonium]